MAANPEPPVCSAISPDTTTDHPKLGLLTVAARLFQQHKLAVGFLVGVTVWFQYLGALKIVGELGWGSALKTLVPGDRFHLFCYETFVKQTTAHDLYLGIMGILVGFFVALIIERANQEKSQLLHDETIEIRHATEHLKALTSNVANDIKSAAEEAKKLIVITDYKELLIKIGEVIDHAEKSDGELLIMNLTASFGYFMTFDSDHVLNTDHLELSEAALKRNEELNKTSHKNYFGKWTDLKNKQRANEDRLKRCAIGGGDLPNKRVTYVTLRAGMREGENTPVPFVSHYLNPSLAGARVETYDTKLNHVFSQDYSGHKKVFLIPHSLISTSPGEDAKNDFEQHLVKDQLIKIAALRSAHIEVKELDQIPFQLYVSLPSNGREREPGMCLFMFVNQHTLGRTNNLAAFVTSDREILGSFKTIIESVVQDSAVRSTGVSAYR